MSDSDADAHAVDRHAPTRSSAVSRPNRTPRLHAASLLALVLATPTLLASRALIGGLPDFAVSSDNAVIELYTRSAAHGEQWLGPYSRLGFHHPGPLMFYLLTPFYQLGGGRFSGLLLGAVVLNGIALAAMVIMVWRAAGPSAADWAAGALILYELFLGPALLYSVWNPNLSILPFMAAIVAIAGSMAGRPWMLAAAVGFGSFALQSHLGYAPPLALAGVVCVGASWRRARLVPSGSRERREWLTAAAAAAGAALVLWLPVAVEEVTGHPGNVTRIVGFLAGSGHGHSLGDALRTVGGAVGAPFLLVAGADALGSPHATPSTYVASTAIVALCGWAAIRATRRRQAFGASLAVLVLTTALAATLAVIGITGAVEPYLVRWMTGLGALGAIAVTATFIAPRGQGAHGPAVWVAPAIALALASVSFAGAARAPSLETQAGRPQFARTGRLANSVETALRGRGLQAVKVGILSGPAWESAAGTALRLVKDGFRVGVDPAWFGVFGRSLRLDEADAAVVFADSIRAQALAGQGGVELVAAEGPVAVLLVRGAGGGSLSFDFGGPDSVLYCAEGFSGPELRDGSFRWSRGTRSVLSLPLRVATRYRVTIELASVTVPHRTQEVTVLAGGNEVGRFPVGTGRTALEVELTSPSGEPRTELELRYTLTVRPDRSGGPPDTRELAVRLYRLTALPCPAVGTPSAERSRASGGGVRDTAVRD